MNKVSNAFNRSKEFVVDHKIALTVFTTATVTAVVSKKMFGAAYETATDFIAERGLTDDFNQYIPRKN